MDVLFSERDVYPKNAALSKYLYIARFSGGQNLALEELKPSENHVNVHAKLKGIKWKRTILFLVTACNSGALQAYCRDLILWIIDETFAVLTLMGQTGITFFHWPLESSVKFLCLEVDRKKVS